MPVHQSVLELIGNTPIVKARRIDSGPCELFFKLESHNPGGSIKDRIGLSMIEGAERAGKIKPGDTLVEGTAGNTGIGLALVAQQKGYRLILVVPDKMSREKIFNLKAMGAQVVLTRSDVAKGHPDYYQDMIDAAVASGTQYDHTQQHWIHDALEFRALDETMRFGLVGIPMLDIRVSVTEAAR